MSVDERLREMLAEVDRPRHPRGEFADALRGELIDGAGTNEAPTAPSRQRRSRVALGAVAAALLIVVVAVRASGGDPVSVIGDGPATTAESPVEIVEVCREFRATAFGRYTQEEILGAQNGGTVSTVAEATEVVTTLSNAVRRLRSGIESAGRASAPVEQDLARTLSELATQERRLAALTAPDAVPPPTSMAESPLAPALRRVGDRLRAVDTALVQGGVPSCL